MKKTNAQKHREEIRDVFWRTGFNGSEYLKTSYFKMSHLFELEFGRLPHGLRLSRVFWIVRPVSGNT